MRASPDKLTVFWAVLILIGVVLALFFGVGWLFLAVTLRRAVMYLPPLRRLVREHLLGLPPEELRVEDPAALHLARMLSYATLVAWTALTIFAFIALDVPLLRLLGGR